MRTMSLRVLDVDKLLSVVFIVNDWSKKSER